MRRNNNPRLNINNNQRIRNYTEADLSLKFNLALGNDLSQQYRQQQTSLCIMHSNNKAVLRNIIRNLQIEFANRLPNPEMALEISLQHFNAVIARDENNN